MVWADTPLAARVLPILQSMRPQPPIFLCQKASQLDSVASVLSSQKVKSTGQIFAVSEDLSGEPSVDRRFQQLYLARTGTLPGFAASEMYNAVHLVATALRATGANRISLRDYLANERTPGDSSTKIPFDPAGNSLQPFTLVPVQLLTPLRP